MARNSLIFANFGKQFSEILHHFMSHPKSIRLEEDCPKYYNGRTPVVHITDPKIIHKILFTESEHFQKRSQDLGHPMINEVIEFLNGEKWKIVRNVLTPQFTTGKLKNSSHIVQNICKEYVQFLKGKINSEGRIEKVDVHEMMAPFAIEVIAEMLCGIKINDAKNPNNQFIKDMRVVLLDGMQIDGSFKYVLTFPFLEKLFPFVTPSAMTTLRQYLEGVFAARENSTNKNQDMVWVLLEMRRRCSSPEYKRLGITEDTVYAQAFEFFLGSYAGLLFAAKMLVYHLLDNPEVHQKVLKEIEQTLNKFNGEVSYDSVVEMEYLGACFMETLRIAPGFFRPDRTCIKDWSHESLRIPKGMTVSFPIYAIHHNPEIHPEPGNYKPERFLGESKASMTPCSFMTFGQGSRQCIGMRLAQTLVKIFLVSLLKEFKMEKRADTVWKEAKGNSFGVYLDPIYVDFVRK